MNTNNEEATIHLVETYFIQKKRIGRAKLSYRGNCDLSVISWIVGNFLDHMMDAWIYNNVNKMIM